MGPRFAHCTPVLAAARDRVPERSSSSVAREELRRGAGRAAAARPGCRGGDPVGAPRQGQHRSLTSGGPVARRPPPAWRPRSFRVTRARDLRMTSSRSRARARVARRRAATGRARSRAAPKANSRRQIRDQVHAVPHPVGVGAEGADQTRGSAFPSPGTGAATARRCPPRRTNGPSGGLRTSGRARSSGCALP